MTKSITERKKNWLLAGVLAWLIPGLGHFYIARKTRGLIIFATLTITFWIGVALGGTMTADKVYQPMWTYSQALIGSYGGFTYYRQDQVYKRLSVNPRIVELVEGYDPEGFSEDENGSKKPQLRPVKIVAARGGRPDALQMEVDSILAEEKIALAYPTCTVAHAYAGVAGLLNLLCIFDVIMLCLMNAPGDDKKSTSPQNKPTDQSVDSENSDSSQKIPEHTDMQNSDSESCPESQVLSTDAENKSQTPSQQTTQEPKEDK